MADVVPFFCIRPREDCASEVASLPYDVFSLDEARAEIERHPRSFLRIDLPEATLPYAVETHDDAVYAHARALLDEAIEDGTYVEDGEPCYYLYRLRTSDGRSQTGVVGCASIDDYENGVVKKHEKTRADKERDRIRHVDTCSAQTGPIFLAFRSDGAVEGVIDRVGGQPPLYDFEADDGVRHTVWRVDDLADSEAIRCAFERTPALYIADGHHRAASAVKAGLLRREAAIAAAGEGCEVSRVAQEGGCCEGEDDARGGAKVGFCAGEDGAHDSAVRAAAAPALESDHFLSVIFPSDQLTILDYNRVVADLNGLGQDAFLDRVKERFEVSGPYAAPRKPERKGTFGMYLGGAWYGLAVKDAYRSDDPVSGLDVALLQDNLLGPVLGIDDPRTDKRIDFVGGIRGLGELARRVDEGMAVAFALYPTSIDELFAVADAGLLMPPKSTWFEPKLRSGLFIHRI
ncbi:DUF1015 domain-containing protein [Raoultibacter phocaeensis]|uniref:DUF1015 domain-containing protein n=1 Tax=Raoultibacter phocaeensis TaxID=2479841 RepID=UPI002105392B|nr:DUF1015 family protein [Raoultibacter phocaeensis]